jgi:hypothetical protein
VGFSDFVFLKGLFERDLEIQLPWSILDLSFNLLFSVLIQGQKIIYSGTFNLKPILGTIFKQEVDHFHHFVFGGVLCN